MNIRLLSLAFAAVCGTACVVQDSQHDNPSKTSQLDSTQQDIESPRCGPVCDAEPSLSGWLAAAYGPDCATAYARTNAHTTILGNCQYYGYPRACDVTSVPQFCYWVPDVGQYEGYIQIDQGCADTTC